MNIVDFLTRKHLILLVLHTLFETKLWNACVECMQPLCQISCFCWHMYRACAFKTIWKVQTADHGSEVFYWYSRKRQIFDVMYLASATFAVSASSSENYLAAALNVWEYFQLTSIIEWNLYISFVKWTENRPYSCNEFNHLKRITGKSYKSKKGFQLFWGVMNQNLASENTYTSYYNRIIVA